MQYITCNQALYNSYQLHFYFNYYCFCLQAEVERKIDLRIQPALKTLGTAIMIFLSDFTAMTSQGLLGL